MSLSPNDMHMHNVLATKIRHAEIFLQLRKSRNFKPPKTYTITVFYHLSICLSILFYLLLFFKIYLHVPVFIFVIMQNGNENENENGDKENGDIVNGEWKRGN